MSGDGFGRWVSAGIHLDPYWDRAPDQKYIVFNREEFVKFVDHMEMMKAFEDMALYDAVVIRTQDAMAGPALHTYAATISLAAQLLDGTRAKTLSNIADYFHFRALEADDGPKRLPD